MSLSSSTHQCPQIDETVFNPSLPMEKSSHPQHLLHLQQQEVLNCPRCNSSNTKFCYYNNYSLSQPRHFCKACKRYWTRGGTLRNVPVGGGCRKNKKVKRSTSSTSTSPSSDPTPPPTLKSSTPTRTTQTTMNHQVHPLFYNQSDITTRFSRPQTNGLALESQFNDFGMSLPIPNMMSSVLGGCGYESRGYIENGKNYKIEIDPKTRTSDVIASNSIVPNFPLFLESSSSTSTSTTSLIASNLQHQNFQLGDLKEASPTNHFQDFSNDMNVVNEVKIEQESKPISQSPVEHIGLFDWPVYWNSMNAGAWPDLSNYGSSVTSLI